ILRLENNIEITKQTNHILFPYKSTNSVDNQEIAISEIQKLLDKVINYVEFSQEEKEIISFIIDETQSSYIRWGVCEGAIRQLQILPSSSQLSYKQVLNELLNIISTQKNE
ncbi:hypothetical protein, partial [Terribacillus saccharophilus]|uniref:hypothetical protein n=1 Tax=Terribacillus saccharophilus TaxID=361277 RepID=UPI000BD4D2EB